MSLIAGLIGAILALLGVYLLIVDAGLATSVEQAFAILLTYIDSGNQPFAKAVILLGLALAFAIVSIVFYRQKHNIKP